ncbi:MAG: hypothetical protein JWM40_1402 [Frankiales bacterium]|nr:hypothetical protein [Frankiales bacterium]
MLPAGSVTNQSADMPKTSLDLHALPLGTGKSTATPTRGLLERCGGTPSGGPPVRTPPWVGASTWDITQKVAVAGSVAWSSTGKGQHVGSNLVVSGNGLPHRSGVFPVASSDPAFAYNPNPGSVLEHAVDLSLPYDPVAAVAESCETGEVGIAIDGILILDAFDAGGNDADAVEVQDTCHGHPNEHAGYHYHGLSPCLLDATSRRTTSLVGWALDGYGIYVEYDGSGRLLTNSSLDGCHGRTSVVPWHGAMQQTYHYDMTYEFPYTVGCFHGTPVATGPGGPPG